MSPMENNGNGGYIVKLRGLPWSATVDDIVKFFPECNILNGKEGVHLTTSREGRPSGEAFVELEDQEDLELALKKDRDHIGSRYIEVFKVNEAEMDWVIRRSAPSYGSNEDGCVRLRGLPFGCSKEEIAQFFSGLEIIPNGITLLTDYTGRSSGEAYVQFINREVAEKALQKHREKIGHRYIEIFRSTWSEVNSVTSGYNNGGGAGGGGGGGGGYNRNSNRGGPTPLFNSRPGPYDRNDRYGGGGNGGRMQQRGSRNFKGPWMGGNDRRNSFDDPWGGGNDHTVHYIHMRGLPFKATPADISDFFKPIVPVSVRILQEPNGRASGEADVEFASHDDAVRAMSKDKSNMQHRYIELFLNSSGPSYNSNNSSNFGGGNRRRF